MENIDTAGQYTNYFATVDIMMSKAMLPMTMMVVMAMAEQSQVQKRFKCKH